MCARMYVQMYIKFNESLINNKLQNVAINFGTFIKPNVDNYHPKTPLLDLTPTAPQIDAN